jgi:hypothetical protein
MLSSHSQHHIGRGKAITAADFAYHSALQGFDRGDMIKKSFANPEITFYRVINSRMHDPTGRSAFDVEFKFERRQVTE